VNAFSVIPMRCCGYRNFFGYSKLGISTKTGPKPMSFGPVFVMII